MSQCVLITGATSGIGKACAQVFAAQGYDLFLMARSGEKLSLLQRELSSSYSTIHVATVAVDVGDRQGMEKVFTDNKNLDNLSFVIASAWVAKDMQTIDQLDLDDADEMIATNTNGVVYTVRLALPYIMKQWAWHIITLSSISAYISYSGGSIYGSTKAFVSMFAESIRKDLMSQNIKVTNVCPWQVETNFQKYRFDGDEKRAQAWTSANIQIEADDLAQQIYAITQSPLDIAEIRIPHRSK